MAAKVRHHTLDGMRGAAALLVATYHVLQRHGDLNFSGYLAVDLFFGLSGFVIAYSYDDRLEAGLPWNRFLESRLARLFPLYFIGWLLGVARQLASSLSGDAHGVSLLQLGGAALFNLFMLPTPVMMMMFPLNGAAWSLFFEIVICALYVTVLARVRSGILIAVAAVSFFYLACHVGAPEYLNIGWSWDTILSGLARALFSFVIGMLIRRYVSIRRVPSKMGIVVIACMIVLIVGPVPPPYKAAWQLLLVGVLFPLLLIAGLSWEMPKRCIPFTAFLGDLSYPIYAIHWPLIALLRPIEAHAGLSPAMLITLYLVMVMALSYVLGRYYDVTARLWMSRRLHVRRSAKPQFFLVSGRTRSV